MQRNPNSSPPDDVSHGGNAPSDNDSNRDARRELAPLPAPKTSALTRIKSVARSLNRPAGVACRDRPLRWRAEPAFFFTIGGSRWFGSTRLAGTSTCRRMSSRSTRCGVVVGVWAALRPLSFCSTCFGSVSICFQSAAPTPRRAARRKHAGARTYRIYFHNVHGFGDGYEGTFAEMMDAGADVVVFTELAWRWRRAAMEQEILSKLPFSTLCA